MIELVEDDYLPDVLQAKKRKIATVLMQRMPARGSIVRVSRPYSAAILLPRVLPNVYSYPHYKTNLCRHVEILGLLGLWVASAWGFPSVLDRDVLKAPLIQHRGL